MTTLDLETARHNMIECQVRTWDVMDERVLELLARAPREDYVPTAYRNFAYADMNLPLPHGRVMMQPKVEARILQELAIKLTDRILEVGTGSGYLTALLTKLGGHVVSVEAHDDLARAAMQKLTAHGIANVMIETGDAVNGWSKHAPYDVIVLTGSVPRLPSTLRDQLAPGGRLFAIVGRAPAMEAKLIARTLEGGFDETSLFETDLPPLPNVAAAPEFVF